ncbi:MAG: sulfotransferase family 2 domain-containing protein [Cyanobacteria bacterium P01_A01_bin.123]
MKHFKQIVKNILLRGKPNLFFMHIPKTGGTSIDFAISRHYPISKYYVDPVVTINVARIVADQNLDAVDFEACFSLRENILAYKMGKGIKYVTGHVPFRTDIWEAFHHQYLFTAILRDPIRRFISQYFYNKHKQAEYSKIDLDFSDYIASEAGARCGATYVRYFMGSSKPTNLFSAEAIQAAKNNLSKFSMIGFLEKLDLAVESFAKISELKLNVPHQNKNPKKNYQLSEQDMAKVRQICAPDIEIYDYAKHIFLEGKKESSSLVKI